MIFLPANKTGYFTSLRHSFKRTPIIAYYESVLEKAAENEDQAKESLIKFLKDKNIIFNNHSFANYLLDNLIRNDNANGDWQKFIKKPISFYNGEVYRSSRQKPEIAFKKGMKCLSPSSSISNYTRSMSGECGISTTKSKEIAIAYASPSARAGKDIMLSDVRMNYGYVYVIDYRGAGGVDVDETKNLRNETNFEWSKKQEVNIIGNIDASDIVGAYPVLDYGTLGTFIENKNYKKDLPSVQVAPNEVARRETLFRKKK